MMIIRDYNLLNKIKSMSSHCYKEIEKKRAFLMVESHLISLEGIMELENHQWIQNMEDYTLRRYSLFRWSHVISPTNYVLITNDK